MKLSKNTIIRFIYKGKQERFKIMFFEYYNSIPLYYSNEVDETCVIKLEDNSIFIVTNSHYRAKLKADKFDLEIWHCLVESLYNSSIADIYCAYWFDFQSVINLVKTLSNIEYAEKEKRIKLLEKILISKDTGIKVETQQSVIDTLRFVEVT